jgi:rare lipoprotein A (peptidoglycan hydrolase)
MSDLRTVRLAFAILVATCFLGLAAIPAAAAPSAAQTAEDRAAVNEAVAKLEAAQQKSADIAAQVEEASAELDQIIADEQRARERLTSRARVMYRSGNTSFLAVLLSAESFQDFATRWDLLSRMNRQDAQDLVTLRTAREEADRSAQALMALQAEQAEAIDAQEAEVARAREELAASEAALAAYNARIAAQAEAAKPAASTSSEAASTPSDSTPQTGGSGAWQTAVASHYGRNFSGRAASGAEIGPYSMMVAHRTLPFGTLVEFQYRGKRAVASVEDRGPHVPGRTWDLGPGVVRTLGFSGVDEVRWRLVQ